MKYWQGISDINKSLSKEKPNTAHVFDFLDAAYQFVVDIKGKVDTSASEAINLYKTWKLIRNKNHA